ncbi:hypothetical protein HanOQP8_Chr02g0047151 [Helianthus annuus]|nr:hypothetical protein HanOQP8_Chr02g0047151 [Helianthus annuus]
MSDVRLGHVFEGLDLLQVDSGALGSGFRRLKKHDICFVFFRSGTNFGGSDMVFGSGNGTVIVIRCPLYFVFVIVLCRLLKLISPDFIG